MHVSEVRGIGPKKADLLKSMGIVTLGDMLAHYPYAYEDRSRVTPIAEASEGAACYIRAAVLKISKNFAYGRNKQMLRLTAADDSGTVEIIFFQASYYERSFQTDESYYFYGRVTKGKNGLQMVHPEFERDPGHFEGSILPIYRTTKGVTQKDIEKDQRICAFSESLRDGNAAAVSHRKKQYLQPGVRTEKYTFSRG